MKKLLVTMAVAIAGAVQAFALSPSAIRENARFLTDRMAYELNLTPRQYEDCYEINYDFICSINPIMDEVVYGYPEYIDRYYNYLDYRNDDLRYIMTEAQYVAFMSLDYFFRPIYTYAGNWLFRVFQIYTNTRFFYYDPPVIYHTYLGGHGRVHYPHGYYGGGRYAHHVYAHPYRFDRGHSHYDFGPGAHRRPHHAPAPPRHHDPGHANPPRHDRGNDHHYGRSRNEHHRDGGAGGRNGSGGRQNGDGINHRGGDHGQGGGMGRGDGNGGGRQQARPQGGGQQMRQQQSGRAERVQGNVAHGASRATRAAASSHSAGGTSHRSSGTTRSGSNGASRGGGSSHGGSGHSNGHRR